MKEEMQLKFEVSDDNRKVTMKTAISYNVPFDQTPEQFIVSLSRFCESAWAKLGYEAKAHAPEQVNEA